MLVKMKRYEDLARQYAERFKKVWDNYIIASDAYLAGYRQGRHDTLEAYYDDKIDAFSLDVGEELVEVEFKDGQHMIGAKLSDSK